MFNMVWDIKIGKYKLGLLESVEIHKSVDLLSDTAFIKLPASVFNQSLRVNDKLNIGDAVCIKLGYDDELKTEFEGYLKRISNDGGTLMFECEDGMYLTKKRVQPKQLKKVNIKQIAEYLTSQIGMKLSCSINASAQYESFVIPPNITAYDILKKIQDDNKVNIYMKGDVLNIHNTYIENFGKVAYDFAINIESANLKYRHKEDRPFEVIIKNHTIGGKTNIVTVGTPGGEQRTITTYNKSEESMRDTALNELKYLSYEGYEGNITGWLIPYVEPGYSAEIHDKEFEYKTGTYYVVSVTTTFGIDGGARKVELGIKLNGNKNK